MADGSFEAKIAAKRETKAGIFITLEIQPADLSEALSMLRVGTALMVGWSEILDASVQPIETLSFADAARQIFAAQETKPKRKFDDMPLSQQAALRCNDENFRNFLRGEYPTVVSDGDDSSDKVRYICDVKSRSQFDSDEGLGARWISLERQFQQWLTDKRYADSAR